MCRIWLYFIFSLFLFTNLYSQECKVLLPEIADNYVGDCKQGLAHGKGKASGVDEYQGYFKRGLPHGIGIYTWSSGNSFEGKWRKGRKHGAGRLIKKKGDKEEIREGVWYRGKERVNMDFKEKFRIDTQRSIDAVSVFKLTEGTTVYVNIIRFGSKLPYHSLYVSSSSGTYQIDAGEIRFEHVLFPFTANLRYITINKSQTGYINREIIFTILESGNWEVKLNQ